MEKRIIEIKNELESLSGSKDDALDMWNLVKEAYQIVSEYEPSKDDSHKQALKREILKDLKKDPKEIERYLKGVSLSMFKKAKEAALFDVNRAVLLFKVRQ